MSGDADLSRVGELIADRARSRILLALISGRKLLRLLQERGLTLVSSYQVNLGGTEDFRNLAENPDSKKQSKMNALGSVQLAPLGYLPHLKSQKIAHLNIEAQGWGETAVNLDVRLQVHDPSGAQQRRHTGVAVAGPRRGGRGTRGKRATAAEP